ncbi:NAD-dependent epimerase/dehydratase family protein, partial [Acinetobacter soli]
MMSSIISFVRPYGFVALSGNDSWTTVLLEVMNAFDVKRIVFSSSATVYGMPERTPIAASFPISATNPYGRTK